MSKKKTTEVDETSEEHLSELCKALGGVIVACTGLEHEVSLAIARILGLNQTQERCLVLPLGTQNKINIIRTLAKQFLDKPSCKQVTAIADAVISATTKRNDLVHGFYAHKDKKVAIVSFSGAARLNGNPVNWTPRDLALFVVELGHLRSEAQTLPALFPSPLPLLE